MNIESLTSLSDAELLGRVKRLAQSERQATAALVAHLAEIDNRKLYLREGCRSLFNYCTQVLHLSEHAAYNRIEAAKAANRFPVVVASLTCGDLHLTAVKLLSPVLTVENHRELLEAAKHKSKREIEELVASLRPQADVPCAVRKLPQARAGRTETATHASATAEAGTEAGTGAKAGTGAGTGAGTEAEADVEAQGQGQGQGQGQSQSQSQGQGHGRAASSPGLAGFGSDGNGVNTGVGSGASVGGGSVAGTAATHVSIVVPLAPQRYKVQFTASAATYEKLQRAQDLLRHQVPNGDLAEVFDRALDVLVRELEKKKLAATDRPHQKNRPAERQSRHIPAHVKRAVWKRDQGRCAFVSPDGRRCSERGQLEFDHVQPHGDGGVATVDNVRLLCARHNQYEARLFFGPWKADAVPESVGSWNAGRAVEVVSLKPGRRPGMNSGASLGANSGASLGANSGASLGAKPGASLGAKPGANLGANAEANLGASPGTQTARGS